MSTYQLFVLEKIVPRCIWIVWLLTISTWFDDFEIYILSRCHVILVFFFRHRGDALIIQSSVARISLCVSVSRAHAFRTTTGVGIIPSFSPVTSRICLCIWPSVFSCKITFSETEFDIFATFPDDDLIWPRTNDFVMNYLRQGGYVMPGVCLSVCLSVC